MNEKWFFMQNLFNNIDNHTFPRNTLELSIWYLEYEIRFCFLLHTRDTKGNNNHPGILRNIWRRYGFHMQSCATRCTYIYGKVSIPTDLRVFNKESFLFSSFIWNFNATTIKSYVDLFVQLKNIQIVIERLDFECCVESTGYLLLFIMYETPFSSTFDIQVVDHDRFWNSVALIW